MRGRKPKPLQRAFAEGDTTHMGANKLARRLESLPKGVRGIPDPPAHLNAEEREQWAVWRQDLELMGADYRADAVTLEGACVQYVRAVKADAEVRREGTRIKEPIQDRVTGEIIGYRSKIHPSVTVSNASWVLVRSYCSELGLTLISRQRLSLESGTPMEPQDELARLLETPRDDVKEPIQ